ncbi:hypothetical protein BD324DRAFT_346512 [Kockovaella imperatae]|uniref:Transcription factor BYE1 n=1 Tax=Kockovaella imperatae TaxID=4999 RepID=A0A1Y1UMB5_9TREE|nr:hypothetical protein BD324DRAFT_346512 [Kockovaella imperatae]ORX38275.1 hypothetical protein BD324DRAFT_346512 [Kockovaella imperatae]
MSAKEITAAGPSTTPARTSGRTRVKSQRALESEHVERLFTLAKNREANPSPARNASAGQDDDSSQIIMASSSKKVKSKPPKSKSKKRTKKQSKDSDTYCICQSDGEDGRPMIECGTCDNWFHFDCLELSVDEAERIHEFVCPDCQTETGKKTTHTYDLDNFPSPSPPPGIEKPSTSKTRRAKAANLESKVSVTSSPSVHSVKSSSSDGSGSEVDSVSDSSDDSDSDVEETHKPVKKKIKTLTHKPVNSVDGRLIIGDRQPASQRSTKAGRGAPTRKTPQGALAPARAFVLMKLGQALSGLFKDESQSQADQYARELELGLWNGFKEVINGKDTAGSKYKGQFTLLNQSLNVDLRQDTLASILNRTISPAQVANLTNVELASSARLAELEAAKQERLASIVKSSKDQAATIRLGRDGLERAEDAREKEMSALRAAEEAQRAKEREAQRRREMEESGGTIGELGAVPLPDKAAESQSPTVATPKSGPRPSASSVSGAPPTGLLPSPRKSVSESPKVPVQPQRQFSLSSAWGGAGGVRTEEDGGIGLGMGGGDQSQLDLSDIAVEVVDDDDDLGLVGNIGEGGSRQKSEIELFNAKPVIWSGAIVNPAKSSPHAPPVQVRHISARHVAPIWTALLPTSPVEITGRVPTTASTQYLETSRMTPTKELIVVAMTLDPSASDSQKAEWAEMINFHIQKDRHALIHPYGTGRDAKAVPPGGARELYLIPLRPSDPSPSFTDLIDGYALPKEGRTESLFVGVFITNRTPTPMPAPPPKNSAPIQVQRPTPPVNVPAPPLPSIETQKLQALMASLNPQALQGVLGGITPPGSQGSSTPQPSYSGPHPSYYGQPDEPRYGQPGQYPPYHSEYNARDGLGAYQGYDERHNPYDAGRSGDSRGGDRRGPSDWERERERDQGWGSRGQRGA